MAATPDSDARLGDLVSRWVEGKATLKEVRGYTDDELYAVARTGHAFFSQGLVPQARTIFQGLFAISPRDPYLARALAVVEYAAGNTEGALGAFDVAVKLDPSNAASYLGRAEVRLASGQRREAQADLSKAVELAAPREPLRARAEALLGTLTGPRR